jgi:hypothetical protein
VAFFGGLALCVLNAVGRVRGRSPAIGRWKALDEGSPSENWLYLVGIAAMVGSSVLLRLGR